MNSMIVFALFFWIMYILYVMSGYKHEPNSWDYWNSGRHTSAQMRAIGNRHGLRRAKRQMRRMMR